MYKRTFTIWYASLMIVFIVASNNADQYNELKIPDYLESMNTLIQYPIETSLSLGRQYSTDRGEISFGSGDIVFAENGLIKKRVKLHPGNDVLRGVAIARNGAAIAYVVEDSVSGYRKLFLRERAGLSQDYQQEIFIYQPRLAAPFERLQVCDVSMDGETILFREDAIGGNCIKVVNQASSQNSQQVLLFKGRQVGYEAKLSGDGRWAFFYVWTANDENLGEIRESTLYSFYQDGKWSSPQVVQVDGEPIHYGIQDVNIDGTKILLYNQVIERNGTRFSHPWELETEYDSYTNLQIDDSGKFFAFVSYNKIVQGRQDSNIYPLVLHLYLARFDGNIRVIKEIDQSQSLVYTLSRDGKSLIWIKKETNSNNVSECDGSIFMK